jgi:hypothetical protein
MMSGHSIAVRSSERREAANAEIDENDDRDGGRERYQDRVESESA